MAAPINLPVNAPANIDTPSTGRYNLFLNSSDSDSLYKKDSAGVSTPVVAAGTGTVTSVSFTGGLISVATATTTPALTVAGTSGGIPYFSSASTWATSAALAANSIVIGGGAGVAPSTITTGTGVVTALGVNVGSAGAFVVNGGVLGTPSSGTLTNCTGLVLTTGVTGVLPTANGGTGVNIATTALTLGTASSAVGSIVLQNATNANTITIQSGVTTSSHTLTLPVANASGVLTNDGVGGLSWAASSSGITIDSTAITGGGANRILFENSLNQVSESSTNFYFQTASPFAHVYAAGRTGVITGIDNTAFGYQAGLALTSGTSNTYIGSGAGYRNITGSYNVYLGNNIAGDIQSTNLNYNIDIGYNTGRQKTGSNNINIGYLAGTSTWEFNVAIGNEAMNGGGGNRSVAVGYQAGAGNSGGSNVAVGFAAGQVGSATSTISIGRDASATASNQGVLGGNSANGFVSNWYYNGVTHTAPYGVNIRASGGSGSNINGADLSFYAGLPTGDGSNVAAGRNGIISFWTGDVGASGTTLRSATEKIRISQKGNFLIGGTAENTSATKALVLANGTEASALLANAICIQSQDTSAGLASLSIYVEDTVQAVAAEVLSNYLRVRINGVEYKLAIIA